MFDNYILSTLKIRLFIANTFIFVVLKIKLTVTLEVLVTTDTRLYFSLRLLRGRASWSFRQKGVPKAGKV